MACFFFKTDRGEFNRAGLSWSTSAWGWSRRHVQPTTCCCGTVSVGIRLPRRWIVCGDVSRQSIGDHHSRVAVSAGGSRQSTISNRFGVGKNSLTGALRSCMTSQLLAQTAIAGASIDVRHPALFMVAFSGTLRFWWTVGHDAVAGRWHSLASGLGGGAVSHARMSCVAH